DLGKEVRRRRRRRPPETYQDRAVRHRDGRRPRPAVVVRVPEDVEVPHLDELSGCGGPRGPGGTEPRAGRGRDPADERPASLAWRSPLPAWRPGSSARPLATTRGPTARPTWSPEATAWPPS